MANFMQMMQKAQQVKVKMQELQERVAQMELEGAAANGAVTCRVNGKFELKAIKLDPAVINPQEAEVLEDLIVAAVNDARQKAEKVMAAESEKLIKDMGLPPGMGLPF